jgi:hypothetical protein
VGFDFKMVRTPASADEAELPNSGGVPGYYRFNTRGMAMTMGVFEWADVLHWEGRPTLPTLASSGMHDDRARAAIAAVRGHGDPDERLTDAELAAARELLRAHDEAVSRDSLRDGRVGAWKFASNDGWLVTPDECRAIAARLRAHAEVIASDFFPDAGIPYKDGLKWVLGFARYNEIAAEHGGYRVH